MNKNLIEKLLMMLISDSVEKTGFQYPLDTYMIVRCRDAGVWAGNYQSHNGREVIIKNGRRLYKWETLEAMTLSACAKYGINDEKSKLSDAISDNVLLSEFCELLPCTINASLSISGAKKWEQ